MSHETDVMTEMDALGIAPSMDACYSIADEWEATADGMTIQTIILSKVYFPEDENVRQWIQKHGFTISKPFDEKDATWRIRQKNPEDFIEGSFRTIKLRDGVKAVVGKLADGSSDNTVWRAYILSRARWYGRTIDLTSIPEAEGIVEEMDSLYGFDAPQPPENSHHDLLTLPDIERPYACLMLEPDTDILKFHICAPGEDKVFETKVIKALPAEYDGKTVFVYGSYEEVSDLPHQVIAWSVVSSHASPVIEAEFSFKKLGLPTFKVGYGGGKAGFMDWILSKKPNDVKSVVDPMGGGMGSAYGFRMAGCAVKVNDILFSSYALGKAVIENPGVSLSDDDMKKLMSCQSASGWASSYDQHYKRQFMTPVIRGWIDGYVAVANQLEGFKRFVALSALTKAIIQASAHSGSLNWGPTSAKLGNSSIREFQRLVSVSLNYMNKKVGTDKPRGLSERGDAIEFAKKHVGADLLYLDPPYITESAPTSIYRSHQLMSDVVEQKYNEVGDKWSRESFPSMMNALFEAGKGYKYVLFSYRDNTTFPRGVLRKMLLRHFSHVALYVLPVRYSAAPTDRQDAFKEILFFATNQKDVQMSEEEHTFSGFSDKMSGGEGDFSSKGVDLQPVSIHTLTQMTKDPGVFPVFVGKLVRGDAVTLDTTAKDCPVTVPQGVNHGVLKTIRDSDGVYWAYDATMIDIDGKKTDITMEPFERRLQAVRICTPTNQEGDLKRVEFVHVHDSQEMMSPLVIGSKDSRARGVFIMPSGPASDGFFKIFENNEGVFGKVIRSNPSGGKWNTVIDTQEGYVVATVDHQVSTGDPVAVFSSSNFTRMEDASKGLKWLTAKDTDEMFVFLSGNAVQDEQVNKTVTNAISGTVPPAIYSAVESSKLKKDPFYSRPHGDGKFVLKVGMTGHNARLFMVRDDDWFEIQLGLTISREPKDEADAKKCFGEEHLKNVMNMLSSAKLTMTFQPEHHVTYMWDVETGKYQVGMVSQEMVEMFFQSDNGLLNGRYIASISSRAEGTWNFTHSPGTPFSLVRGTSLPPMDHSGVPPDIQTRIPPEYQYWKVVSRDHRDKVRDNLIDAIASGDVKLMAEPAPVTFTLSHQTYKKPVKTATGYRTEYHHLRMCRTKDCGRHFFLFGNPEKDNEFSASYLGRTSPDFMTMEGSVKPSSNFNTTQYSSDLRILTKESSGTVLTMFDDWIVAEFDHGPMEGVWSIRISESNTKFIRTVAHRSFSAYIQSFPADTSLFASSPVIGDPKNPKYMEITAPLFVHGDLIDGKGRQTCYKEEDLKKAVLMQSDGASMPYVDMYHFKNEYARVGVILDVWWDAEQKFDYVDVRGLQHVGKGMLMCKFVIQNQDAIRQIMEAKERSISAEMKFDVLRNQERPEWPYAVNIIVRGLAITPDPMVKAAVMDTACTHGTCWSLN